MSDISGSAVGVWTDDDICHLCPGICRHDCPYGLRRQWVPGTEEEELGAAHEPVDCGDLE